jgi:hypothetical protein
MSESKGKLQLTDRLIDLDRVVSDNTRDEQGSRILIFDAPDGKRIQLSKDDEAIYNEATKSGDGDTDTGDTGDAT